MKMLLKLKYGFLSLALYVLFLTLMMLRSANATKLIEPYKRVFINYNDIKIGNKVPIHFGHSFDSEIPHLLPKEKADSIPFSSDKLPLILKFFGHRPGSQQAKAMEITLKMCESKEEGQVRYCATSLEAMLDFNRQVFKGTPFKVLGTSPLPKGSKLLQNYTIVKQPRKIPAPLMVTCHMMIYPYVVYHCHYLEQENQVFGVSLRGEDGANVEAVIICHMDTITFDPDHMAFEVLGFKPGDGPVCHFNPSIDLVWVSAIVDSQEKLSNEIK